MPPQQRSQQARLARRERARRVRSRRRIAALVVALAAVAIALALALAGTDGRRAAARATPGSTAAAGGAGSVRAAAHAARMSGYPESARVRSLIALGRPIYCAARHGDEVALTFDDGPGPYTRLVLAKLEKHHVGATFFIVARNLGLVPGAPRAERALGAVGDHTFTHPLLTALGAGEAESEMVRAQSAIAAASGGPVFLFRPPYGAHDTRVDGVARAHGMLQILWTVDSRDSLGADYAEIERNVIAGLRPGSIILMHENHGQTVRALLAIFAALQRKHLRAVSVPQLLTDDPPTAAQVRAGGAGCGVRGGITGGS